MPPLLHQHLVHLRQLACCQALKSWHRWDPAAKNEVVFIDSKPTEANSLGTRHPEMNAVVEGILSTTNGQIIILLKTPQDAVANGVPDCDPIDGEQHQRLESSVVTPTSVARACTNGTHLTARLPTEAGSRDEASVMSRHADCMTAAVIAAT